MKVRLAGITFCIVAAGTCFHFGLRSGAGRPVEKSMPVLTISPAEFDFGTVDQVAELTTQFRVTNHHTEPVTIQSVSKGCSCSSADFEKMSLGAGESTNLNVTWNVSGKRGKVAEFLAVSYVCGSTIPMQFARTQMVADVQREVVCDTEPITFSARQPVTRKVCLKTQPSRPIRILAVSTNHPSVQATCANDNSEVEVRFDPSVTGWRAGHLSVTIRTDSQVDPSIVVSVAVME